MHVFLCCVKRSLHKSRLINIKLFNRARLLQSHTNNGFFKLVEVLLQICSFFVSHSMKLYVVYRYLHCHRLAAFPAMISVFSSHMQGSHSVISNKPRLHNEINRYSYNKNRSSSSWGQWCPATLFKICAPFSCFHVCFSVTSKKI